MMLSKLLLLFSCAVSWPIKHILGLSLDNVYVCGYPYSKTFARNVLGASQTPRFENGFVGTPNDVAVASHKCGAQNFTGILIYVDGESGVIAATLPKDRRQVIYLGVRGDVKIQVKWNTFVGTLHPSVTRINTIYASEIFNYDKEMFDTYWSRPMPSDQKQRTEFMAYVAGNCVPERQRVFDALVNFSEQHGFPVPHALGKCFGSGRNSHTRQDKLRNSYRSNHEVFTKYRYVLAMENVNKDFYMTEKILLPLRGGAIPIYWGGGSEAASIFHPDVYIPINDPMGPLTEVFNRILDIEANPASYTRATQTPILLHGERTALKYFPVSSVSKDLEQSEYSLKRDILGALTSKLLANNGTTMWKN